MLLKSKLEILSLKYSLILIIRLLVSMLMYKLSKSREVVLHFKSLEKITMKVN